MGQGEEGVTHFQLEKMWSRTNFKHFWRGGASHKNPNEFLSCQPAVIPGMESVSQDLLNMATEKQIGRYSYHRRCMADSTVIYKIHTSLCPSDLKALLPTHYITRCATRSSPSIPAHALKVPIYKNLLCWQRSFIPTAVKFWNGLPDNIFGQTFSIQSFQTWAHRHVAWLTLF